MSLQFQLGAMDRCKAMFQRVLVVLLGAALLSQLALLPTRANGLSIQSISEGDHVHGSLLERDLIIPRVNRIERYFTDAGSHTHFSRALDEGMVQQGARFICALNERRYLAASAWTDPNNLEGDVEGWRTTDRDADPPIINTLEPWLSVNGLSSDATSYQTVISRNDKNKPGSGNGEPTGATMKNIFNLGDGTVIVEDVTNPNSMPALIEANYKKNLAEFIKQGSDPAWLGPAPDPSNYVIPDLAKWSDIAYLQIARVAGGDTAQMKNVQRIIQYHVINKATQDQIREALATVDRSIDNVRIDQGNAAVTFPATSKACQALFKTPNGNGGYFLFAQHPEQLGSRTLDSISVFTSERNTKDNSAANGEDVSVWYFMVASFIDAPEQGA
ncbi:hypothetical protein B0J13DRAFT_644791 [Dactylonectria estremocensis]|uniref:Uncharacterized protein n=1 Tax=Dactylonectria estremocensis TaxID=1079267 RepID=A0A9P9E095_9HYPO|nr:hypothetical protein B0J13DRAFT_644791 [Dactylonectria estremocensis]